MLASRCNKPVRVVSLIAPYPGRSTQNTKAAEHRTHQYISKHQYTVSLYSINTVPLLSHIMLPAVNTDNRNRAVNFRTKMPADLVVKINMNSCFQNEMTHAVQAQPNSICNCDLLRGNS